MTTVARSSANDANAESGTVRVCRGFAPRRVASTFSSRGRQRDASCAQFDAVDRRGRRVATSTPYCRRYFGVRRTPTTSVAFRRRVRGGRRRRHFGPVRSSRRTGVPRANDGAYVTRTSYDLAFRRREDDDSFRTAGNRPSDRRGPGLFGHEGRNLRSTCRCSHNLRITRRRAVSCGLHRPTSQVIHRSGLYYRFR